MADLALSSSFDARALLPRYQAIRQAAREVTKLIPFVGSLASGALAGASTFALGKAICYHYGQIHKGHVPSADDLRKYYREQLTIAEGRWKASARP